MHSVLGIWHFIVEIFVNVSKGMSSIMNEVVGVHLVIVQEHTSIKVLRKEVESHVIDMGRHDLIDGVLLVAPVNGKGKREVTSLQEGHFTLEILILTGIVELVSVSNTDSSGHCNSLIVLEIPSS